MPENKRTKKEFLEEQEIKEPEIVEAPQEDIDEDEEIGILPGGYGPSQDMVDLWKKRYGQIYSTEVDDEEYYVWRVLTRPELKAISANGTADGLYREEAICEKCVLWPVGIDFSIGKAGVPSVLAEQIFEKSGFGIRSGPVPL